MRHWYTDAAFVGDLVYRISGVRLDAGETALFSRQLTYIVKQTYDVKYPELKARTFIPVNYSIPEGAETWLERGYDWAGMAKIISDYATDLPMVEIMGAEIARGIKSLGSAYQYSLQDLAAAAMSGVPIESKKAFAARRSNENAVDRIAALGSVDANLPGFLTHPNVPLLTAALSNITGGWDTATPQQILADLHAIANAMVVTTKETWSPDTILLPLNRYSLVMTQPYSELNGLSVGKVFLEGSPYIRTIAQWSYLDLADAAGTGPRAVVYKKSPEVVELMIPKEFSQLPPQARTLAFIVNCWSRIGGTVWHYPLGGTYVDGI